MKEAIDNFKERNCILGSGHAFGVKPNVLWYGNHLGPFSGALAQSECQEQGEGSVGGPAGPPTDPWPWPGQDGFME